MTDATPSSSSLPSGQQATRELVGIFARPEPLTACIHDLLAAGFGHANLSVLSSHEAIEAADTNEAAWQDRLMPLVNEARYEVPLVSGLLVALAGGPTAALIGGVVAAGVGLAALKELLEETIALPNSDAFADAVKAGEILLWVEVTDADREQLASSLLVKHGARDLHVNTRG
ncbi:hypothetical protein [Insolitispirillum peregrinum]|uniref:Uncharacterized protein n=1 Tax=Insolitispirillum peregrinum TaxID=80876 RepID=A0A1N7MW08_9PROT|nr:hypothetical protein [Insolitispirillum peregrinum]SIS90272.1 hypothetical protein SAMN05421779_104394 [Insolitispirillum peregrinum]